MKGRQFHFHNGKSGAAITVQIALQARRNEVNEILPDGTIVVHLTASTGPDDNINQSLVQFLAEILRVKITQLDLVAGVSGNDKLITILDLDKEAVNERILAQLAKKNKK